MDGAGISLIIILCLIVIVIICSTIKIVPQAHAYVIERLGTYQATWSVGLHMKMPVIDKVAKKVTRSRLLTSLHSRLSQKIT